MTSIGASNLYGKKFGEHFLDCLRILPFGPQALSALPDYPQPSQFADPHLAPSNMKINSITKSAADVNVYLGVDIWAATFRPR